MILDSLMRGLAMKRGGIMVQPWQEFDMIGGTSTGGLIAIMLGRLRMTIAECMESYLVLSKRIFVETRHAGNVPGRIMDRYRASGKFSAQPLEQCIREMLVAKGKSKDEPLREVGDEDACRVFVCAVQSTNSDSVLMRSYVANNYRYDPVSEVCSITEAARATSAASSLFPPIRIGPVGQEFVDGALGHNNPIKKADRESRGEQTQSKPE